MLKLIDRKKMMMLLVLVVLIIAIFIIFLIVNSNRNLSFAQLENRMIKAAEKYIEDNPNYFDSAVDGNVLINMNQLEQGYMKGLNELIDEEISCFGEVRVSKIEDSYAYYPYLNCGDDYKTTSLYELVIETQGIIEEGPGLYTLGNELVFRGEEVDNYIKFGNRLWRIISFDENYNIKIIEDVMQTRITWDNRFNVERNRNDGINVYYDSKTEHSLIKKHFDKLLFDEEYLKNADWGKLIYMDLCAGARGPEDTDKSGTAECAVIVENQIFGLITAYEFMRTSLDSDCLVTTSPACQNYNYLVLFNQSNWTLTPDSSTSHHVYSMNTRLLHPTNASTRSGARSVMSLNKNVVSSGGSGTADDPYLVK